MPTSASSWKLPEPGQIRRDRWQTGLTEVEWLPVLAARGGRSGPVVLVTGAVHGDEYEGPAAIQTLFSALDMDGLHGAIVGLPVVNPPAWRARTRTTPTDGLDLNRLFPGSSHSSAQPTQRLAEVVYEQFVQQCDVLVDLHSGGVRLLHLPMAGWYQGGARDAERIARGFGATFHPWLVPDVPGVLSYEAHRLGKVSIGAEWGGGGRLSLKGRDAYVQALRGVLAHLTEPRDTDEELDRSSPIAGHYQTTEVGGLFTTAVKLGDRVTTGALLGTIQDELGTVVARPQAFGDGTVAALAHLPWLYPGDRIAYIG